ncbi:MAG: GLUG motif-containing protein [Thermoplasmatota archaeon]
MNKKHWAVVVIFFILISIAAYMFWSEHPKKGSKGNPYMIEDVQGLQDIDKDLDAHYALASDIDASDTKDWNDGKGFKPIGTNFTNSFSGSLDGRGHKIEGLYINRTYSSYVGLFGHIYHGKVNDLGLEEVDVKGKSNVGSIVGVNDFSKVSNCYASGKVSANQYNTGGLVGSNDFGDIIDSHAEVYVIGNESVGGLVGFNRDGDNKESYAVGDVKGKIHVGGFLGESWEGVVEESYSKGDVSGNQNIGGFLGKNRKGEVFTSYSTGDVKGNKSIGGFVGTNNGRLMNTHYNIDDVLINGERNETFCGVSDEEYSDWINSDMGRDIDFDSGSGKKDDPFLVSNLDQLQAIRNDLDAHYALTEDINASETQEWNVGEGFRIIGGYNEPFTGTFDGQEHKINGLYIHMKNLGHVQKVGLFANVGKGGKVSNVNLVNIHIKGNSEVGALVAENKGKVINAYASGYVRCSSGTYSSSGGLVGQNEGKISNSHFDNGVIKGGHFVGGLVGWNYKGSIENSHYDVSSVTIKGDHKITLTGLFERQYDDWISNGKDLDIDGYQETLTPDGDYYEINSIDGLRNLLGFADEEEYRFRLGSDIYFSKELSFQIPYLNAEFDGDNHNIEGLYLDNPGMRKVGLFGLVGSEGVVRDINVIDANIIGKKYVGVLIGKNKGTVINSHTEGNLIGDEYFGGIIGINQGPIKRSSAAVEVSRTQGNHRFEFTYAGGLIGRNFKASIINSHATGSVNGGMHLGGLVGRNYGRIYNSYATGDVNGTKRVGGLVGEGIGKIINCYAKGDVDGDKTVGGLVGNNYEQMIVNCYSVGRVYGSLDTGGLIGDSTESTIKNSYWDVNTSGRTESDGGRGKSTEDMQDIELYSDSDWGIDYVNNKSNLDKDHTWNIVDDETYPFLSGKKDIDEN